MYFQSISLLKLLYQRILTASNFFILTNQILTVMLYLLVVTDNQPMFIIYCKTIFAVQYRLDTLSFILFISFVPRHRKLYKRQNVLKGDADPKSHQDTNDVYCTLLEDSTNNGTYLSAPLMSEDVQRNQRSKTNPKMMGQTFLKMLCISLVTNCQSVARSSCTTRGFAPAPGEYIQQPQVTFSKTLKQSSANPGGTGEKTATRGCIC